MSLNSNAQNGNNPQLLQQRLNVREQEINALKVQNRHLLGRIEDLEKEAAPNQIDTQFVADEVRRHLDPVVQQLKTTINSSFEILQSTMRGIYQQSQRSEKAVNDMASHTRELEIRLNDQRKQDQNFYQDKVFSMISNFSDRLERQVEIRLKALGQIEILNAKQNEILSELESMKNSQESVQKNAEINRNEIARMERTTGEMNQKVIDIQIQTRNSEETTRNTLQQVQNHRAEFRLIRAELKQAIDTMNVLLQNVERSQNLLENGGPANSGSEAIENLLEEKQKEIENLEQTILANQPGNAEEDAAVVLNLLRAQKQELSKAAADARSYLQDQFLKGAENPGAATENRVVEKGL